MTELGKNFLRQDLKENNPLLIILKGFEGCRYKCVDAAFDYLDPMDNEASSTVLQVGKLILKVIKRQRKDLENGIYQVCVQR